MLCLHTILDGKQSLPILSGYAENASKPAPEYGTWSAKGYGCTNAHDVSCTDSCGKGCGKGCKLRHITRRVLVTANRQTYCLKNVALWEFKSYGQEQVSSQQHYYHWPSPEDATYFGNYI